MKPLVVSFFTIGDRYYEEAANGLVASCRRVGVSCHVEGIAARGLWIDNTRLKAPFVCRMLTGRSRPVLWVDCDSEMLSAPTVLEDLQCDFAACDRSEFFGKPARRKWIVGALLFNPTPAARRLAGLWESLCNSDDRHGSDEYYFDVAWRQLRQQVISESLPPHFLALRTARQRGSTPRPGTVVLTTLSGNAARWNRRRRRRERSYPTRQESTEQTVA